MTKDGYFIWGKLNYMSSIMFCISTAFNATLLSATGMLQFLLHPQKKKKGAPQPHTPPRKQQDRNAPNIIRCKYFLVTAIITVINIMSQFHWC